jgi:AraC-like DNA-binding protein
MLRQTTRGRPPKEAALRSHCQVLGGFDVLRARYSRQEFTRHSHQEYLIGVIDGGVHDVWCRGEWWHASAETIATFSPDEPHFGGAGDDAGWSQIIFYVPDAVVRAALGSRDDAPLPQFVSPFRRDGAAARRLRLLYRTIEAGGDPMEIGEAMVETLSFIFARHAQARQPISFARPVERRLQEVRDAMHARLDQPITLDELCLMSGLAKPHLIASFKAAFGLSPHRYLTQIRVERARQLLVDGTAISAAAADVGFADQSHLTRHFRSVLGITPAQLQPVRHV